MLIQVPIIVARFSRLKTRTAYTLLNQSVSHRQRESDFSLSSCSPKLLRGSTDEFLPAICTSTGPRNFVTSIAKFSPRPTVSELIYQSSPKKVQPYLALVRFDKPIGTWLTLLPSLWSLSLASGASGQVFSPTLGILFCIGAFLMRGAGCTINDMWDKDIDRLVTRTKSRPIAASQITRSAALVFLGLQLSCALGILLQLNQLSILVGASCVPMVVAYPLFKRFTYWPQLMLGVTFNWGTLIGWTAVRNSLEAPAFCLLGAAISWTLLYDTIYAHQDKVDDAMIGVKSTALLFGDRTKPFLRACAASTVGSLGLAAYLANASWPLYAGLLATTAHFVWQIETLRINDPADCLKKFKSNRDVGILLLAAFLLSNIVPKVV